MQRPVVFNSLLTFVHNYRDNPSLERLIDDYFSKTTVATAYEALSEHLGPNAVGVPENLVPLYDDMASKGTLPMLAASDLTILPLALLGQENDKNELLREMRQLRRFIHDALNGKIEDPTPSPRIEQEIPTPTSQRDTSASSPEFPVLPTATAIAQVSECPNNLLETSPVPSNNAAVSPPRSLLKRKNTSKSLDAAVKKLTDRQNKSEPRESTSPTDWQPNPMNVSIDPQAYLHMIRMMHTPQSSLFPMLGTNLVKEEKYDGEGDLMLDDNDKHFEDSSPSPSEDIKEDFDMSSNDLEKPFICEHANCQKRFANKFLLKKHQFIHTGLRPHTCPYCNKRFNRKDNLLRHKKTHLQNGLPGDISRQQALNLFITEAAGLGIDEPIDE